VFDIAISATSDIRQAFIFAASPVLQVTVTDQEQRNLKQQRPHQLHITQWVMLHTLAVSTRHNKLATHIPFRDRGEKKSFCNIIYRV